MILPRNKRRENILTHATAREFKGGLNVVDSELNLSSKFARVLTNMYRGIDGTMQVRQGTKLFCDLSSISDGYLLNSQYFANRIISVNDVGQVFATDGTGAAVRIWDSAVAAGTRPGLTTWGITAYVKFEEFNGKLTIHNGQDKPLEINTSLVVDYLADPATGSNINVPIGRIVCKFAKHLIIAIGSDLYVSDEDAAGVWTGDSGATYANIFSMASSVVSGPTDIVGLSPFRDWLLVHFKECTIPIQFVKVTTPSAGLEINDTSDVGGGLDNYGSISQRTSQNLGNMTLSCDIAGVNSIALANFTAKLSPDRPSRLIDPLIKAALADQSSVTLDYGAFSQYDRLNSMYQLFIPNAASTEQTAVKGFGYRYIEKLGIEAWNEFAGWNWAWSARSSEGLCFYGRVNDNKIFVMGNEEKLPLHADYIGEQELFSDNTPWSDNTGWSPVVDVNNSGVPIQWEWDLPWSDLKNRSISKTMRYLILDTDGDAGFTVQLFIDDKYEDRGDAGEPFANDGLLFSDSLGFIRTGFNKAYTPALSIDLVGGDRGGFGTEAYNDTFGGGRNTKFRRNLAFPCKFTTFKLRFTGRTRRHLSIVGITPIYAKGTIRRNSDI